MRRRQESVRSRVSPGPEPTRRPGRVVSGCMSDRLQRQSCGTPLLSVRRDPKSPTSSIAVPLVNDRSERQRLTDSVGAWQGCSWQAGPLWARCVHRRMASYAPRRDKARHASPHTAYNEGIVHARGYMTNPPVVRVAWFPSAQLGTMSGELPWRLDSLSLLRGIEISGTCSSVANHVERLTLRYFEQQPRCLSLHTFNWAGT